jgi:FkbM family methyltransferase
MLFDLYSLLLAVKKIHSQRLGWRGVRLYFAFGRLKIKNRLLQFFNRQATRESFLGYKIRFFSYPTFVYLVEEIFIDGLYQFETKKTAPLIFDCGSNIGISILYFKYRYPDAHIVAFEPDKNTYDLLNANIVSNGLTHVQTHNVALSDSEGSINFYTGAAGSLSASVVRERTLKIEHPATAVRSRKLSGLIDRPIDYLKMDIEGAELECMPEVASSGSLKNVHQLVIECHHNIGSKKPILAEMLSILNTSGFIYQVSSHARFPISHSQTQDVMIYAQMPTI